MMVLVCCSTLAISHPCTLTTIAREDAEATALDKAVPEKQSNSLCRTSLKEDQLSTMWPSERVGSLRAIFSVKNSINNIKKQCQFLRIEMRSL